jgi:predicted HAD superfamily Cof-like phosphohydrolase
MSLIKSNVFNQVKLYMLAHGIPVAEEPTIPTDSEFVFRHTFLLEEVNELSAAFLKEDIVDMADALADIVMVAIGLAHGMGIPLEKVCEIVNEANLTGKRKVTSAEESKRNYEHDLVKTEAFVSPEAKIALLLFGEKNV